MTASSFPTRLPDLELGELRGAGLRVLRAELLARDLRVHGLQAALLADAALARQRHAHLASGPQKGYPQLGNEGSSALPFSTPSVAPTTAGQSRLASVVTGGLTGTSVPEAGGRSRAAIPCMHASAHLLLLRTQAELERLELLAVLRAERRHLALHALHLGAIRFSQAVPLALYRVYTTRSHCADRAVSCRSCGCLLLEAGARVGLLLRELRGHGRGVLPARALRPELRHGGLERRLLRGGVRPRRLRGAHLHLPTRTDGATPR